MKFGKLLLVLAFALPAVGQGTKLPEEGYISPARPVPVGQAPGMQWKLVKDTPEEKVYSIVFYKGDEVMSGLTDFAIAQHVTDAHFTAIGAVNGATLAWLNLEKKLYKPIPVDTQVEVVSLIGDVAMFNGKPVLHMHAVLAKPDGSTVAGHVFALHVNPTVEVFLTANTTPLQKRPDDASGIKVIAPVQ